MHSSCNDVITCPSLKAEHFLEAYHNQHTAPLAGAVLFVVWWAYTLLFCNRNRLRCRLLCIIEQMYRSRQRNRIMCLLVAPILLNCVHVKRVHGNSSANDRVGKKSTLTFIQNQHVLVNPLGGSLMNKTSRSISLQVKQPRREAKHLFINDVFLMHW